MKKSILKILMISGACILALITLFVILFSTIKVTVPNLSNKSITDAKEQLTELHLRVDSVREYNDFVPKGFVISQDVPENTKLRIGKTVTLTVSDGRIPVKVPDVEDLSVAEAIAALENAGFKAVITEEFHDSCKKGTVISQKISAGKLVEKGSEIELIISKGPDLVKVPNVKGKSADAAKKALTDAGLSVVSDIKCSNTVKEGLILSQDIKAGEMVKRNSAVKVYVSAGVANTVGNTPSNSAQWGRVAQQGNWVYYSDSKNGYALYKMKTDGSNKQKLADGVVLGINVLGEWVYYCDTNYYSSDVGLYKIRIDGTKKTKLNEKINYFVHVADGWIYTSNPFGDGRIYKCKLDGTETTVVCKDKCKDILVSGKWIYYNTRESTTVYKIRTDGTNKTTVDKITSHELGLFGDTLISTESHTYFKINTNGSGFTKIYKYNVQKSYINVYNGWVYFLEFDFTGDKDTSAFYKMKYDGSQKTKILDLTYENHANFYICVVGDWLYFPNDDDNDYMYRIRTNGKDLQKVYI